MKGGSKALVGAVRRFSYTPLLGVSAAIMLVKLLVYARLLGVAEFGLFSKALVISTVLSTIGSVGFAVKAQREVPPALMDGSETRAALIILRTIVVTLLIALFVFFFGASAVIAGGGEVSLSLWGLAVAHGSINHVFTILTVESKSRLEMFRYTADVLARTLLCFGFGALAAFLVGNSSAVLVSEILVTLVLFPHLIGKLSWHETSRDADDSMKPLMASLLPGWAEWRTAFLLFLTTVITLVGLNIDRWIGASALESASFGIYSFALITITAAQVVQQIIGAALFPLLARTSALSGGAAAFRQARAAVLGIGLLGLIAVASLLALAPFLVATWFVEYGPAVEILPFLLFAGLLRASDFWTTYLVVREREVWILRGQVIATVVALLIWLFAVAGEGISIYSLAVLAFGLSLLSHLVNLGLSISEKKFDSRIGGQGRATENNRVL